MAGKLQFEVHLKIGGGGEGVEIMCKGINSVQDNPFWGRFGLNCEEIGYS